MHQEEVMVPVPQAADRLGGRILLFPAFSDTLLVLKPSQPYSPLQPRKAKVDLCRLRLVNKVSQHHKQEYSQGG